MLFYFIHNGFYFFCGSGFAIISPACSFMIDDGSNFFWFQIGGCSYWWHDSIGRSQSIVSFHNDGNVKFQIFSGYHLVTFQRRECTRDALATTLVTSSTMGIEKVFSIWKSIGAGCTCFFFGFVQKFFWRNGFWKFGLF